MFDAVFISLSLDLTYLCFMITYSNALLVLVTKLKQPHLFGVLILHYLKVVLVAFPP